MKNAIFFSDKKRKKRKYKIVDKNIKLNSNLTREAEIRRIDELDLINV